MGFSNGFIASIILKNNPLREFNYNGKRTVKVPFGSEYVIRLKNKSNDPALVDITIDGTDVLNGSQLVLKVGESIDLERFVDDNSKGKKFKFISLEEGASTGKIDDPYREENGLIQIKFHKAFYLPKINYTLTTTSSFPPYCGSVINYNSWINEKPSFRDGEPILSNSETLTLGNLGVAGAACNSDVTNSCFFSSRSVSNDLPKDKGATVEGSESKQSFESTTSYIKLGSEPTIIELYMVGPSFKEKEKDVEWGVFVGSNKEPIAKFKDQKHAHIFAGNADFGKVSVTIKEVI